MDSTSAITFALQILAVVVLVLLNGFFVAAEFALVKIRDTQLHPYIAKGHKRATVARSILQNLDSALSAAQLGITLASLGLGWIGEPVFARLLQPVMRAFQIDSPHLQHSLAFAVGFSVITFLHIVAGEQAPKCMAIRKPLPTTLWAAIPLQWFARISFPAIYVLNHSANWLLRQFGIQPISEAEMVHSAEELRLIIGESQRHEGGARLSHDIVLNALDLRHRLVREVMRSRQEIVAINTTFSLPDCLDLAEKTRYSRFPVCEAGDLDRALGVVHIKDLYAMRLKAGTAADLLPVVRKLVFIPETARLEKLLATLLERRLHFALVVDEYGITVGMVTLENILEEVVGQIQDEFDQEKPLVTRLDENTWEVAGLLPLHELEDIVGESLRAGGISTVSGWVTQRLEGFPQIGNTLTVGSFELIVEEVEGMRVARLRLVRNTQRRPDVPSRTPA